MLPLLSQRDLARAAAARRAWRLAALEGSLRRELHFGPAALPATADNVTALCARAGPQLHTLSFAAVQQNRLPAALVVAALDAGMCGALSALDCVGGVGPFNADEVEQLVAACPALARASCGVEYAAGCCLPLLQSLAGGWSIRCARGRPGAAIGSATPPKLQRRRRNCAPIRRRPTRRHAQGCCIRRLSGTGRRYACRGRCARGAAFCAIPCQGKGFSPQADAQVVPYAAPPKTPPPSAAAIRLLFPCARAVSAAPIRARRARLPSKGWGTPGADALLLAASPANHRSC